jgi:hypothetical protein
LASRCCCRPWRGRSTWQSAAVHPVRWSKPSRGGRPTSPSTSACRCVLQLAECALRAVLLRHLCALALFVFVSFFLTPS